MEGKETVGSESAGGRKAPVGNNGIASSIGNFISAHPRFILLAVFMVLAGFAITAGTNNADTLWNAMRDLTGTWIVRLGGVAMFVGGVVFGLGRKNESADRASAHIKFKKGRVTK